MFFYVWFRERVWKFLGIMVLVVFEMIIDRFCFVVLGSLEFRDKWRADGR